MSTTQTRVQAPTRAVETGRKLGSHALPLPCPVLSATGWPEGQPRGHSAQPLDRPGAGSGDGTLLFLLNPGKGGSSSQFRGGVRCPEGRERGSERGPTGSRPAVLSLTPPAPWGGKESGCCPAWGVRGVGWGRKRSPSPLRTHPRGICSWTTLEFPAYLERGLKPFKNIASRVPRKLGSPGRWAPGSAQKQPRGGQELESGPH